MPVTVLGHKDFKANTAVLHIREKAAKNDCSSTGSSTGLPGFLCKISNSNIFTRKYFCNALPVVAPGKKRKKRKKKKRKNKRHVKKLLQDLYLLRHAPGFI